MTCTQGHQSKWSSCTNVGEKKTSAASINVDLTASIFLSGLRFERVKVSFWIYLLNLSLLPQGVLRLDEHPFHFPLRLLQCKIMYIVHVWVMKQHWNWPNHGNSQECFFILISCAVPISLVRSGSLVILAWTPGQNSDRGKGKIFPPQAINHRGIVVCNIFMDRNAVVRSAQEMAVLTVQVTRERWLLER